MKQLGEIKLLQISEKRNLITDTFPESIIAEEFRTVRTNVQIVMDQQKYKLLLVTSPNSGEGKSTIAANLAVSIAQQKENVLLIDANLRQPKAHFIFNIPNTVGLTDILTGKTTFEEAIIRTEVGRLKVLPSGKILTNPTELLSSFAMKELLRKSSEQYDTVIIDSSSVLEVADTNILANQCNGVLLVLHQGRTSLEKAAEAKKILEFSNARMAGVILNEI